MERQYLVFDVEVLTIKDIAGRLKLSEKDVFRVLREHDIM